MNGSLIVTGYMHLVNGTDFNKLMFINTTVPMEEEAEDLFGYLDIAFNSLFKNVTGFGSLTDSMVFWAISRNSSLKKIILTNMSKVASISNIEGNRNTTPEFASIEPLPSLKRGCRSKKNAVPHEELKFETKLLKDVCLIKVLIPTVVGTGIIVFMLIMSFMLFLYMLVDFYSPYRQIMSKERLKDTFVAHLLAFSDVLSYNRFMFRVFCVMAFQEWRTRKTSLHCKAFKFRRACDISTECAVDGVHVTDEQKIGARRCFECSAHIAVVAFKGRKRNVQSRLTHSVS